MLGARDLLDATEIAAPGLRKWNRARRRSSDDGDAYREDDAPVGDGAPEVGGLGAHGAVQERLERRRHGGSSRPAGEPATRERRGSRDRGCRGKETARVRSCGVVGVRGEESDG